MKSLFSALIALTGFVLGSVTVHATALPPSADSPLDTYGCNAAEGSRWCSTMRKCIQPWVLPCPSDRSPLFPEERNDSQGCDRTMGYEWCAHSQQCYLPWEKSCEYSEVTGRWNRLNQDGRLEQWCPSLQRYYLPYSESCPLTLQPPLPNSCVLPMKKSVRMRLLKRTGGAGMACRTK